MKKSTTRLATVLIGLSFFQNSTAAVLRVNNTPGMAAPFSNLNTALAAANTGDTLYIEGSNTSYSSITINKKLRIIGPGYFQTEPNPYTQADKLEATFSSITFGGGSDGSVIQGVKLSGIYLRDSLITIERCHIGSIYFAGEGTNPTLFGDTIRNNYITNSISTFSNNVSAVSCMIYNNIFIGSGPINISNSSSNGYIVNNTFAPTASSSIICSNFLLQNNIFRNMNIGSYGAVNAFYNNIFANTPNIPNGNDNIFNASWNSLFVDEPTASADGKFKLAPLSIARSAGIINNTPVDCGAFGGAAPYILSGMPNVPVIYELTVPNAMPSGTNSMLVNLSAATH